MQHRMEIDGLRAIAVLPVILFHAGAGVFQGGFVGVDVFFVISGYLITALLIRDLETKRFSLIDFYERRARRILPALFLTLTISAIPSYFLMNPSQLEEFGKSLIAVVFFVSNVLFWRESDYFGQAAEMKPLLHTWSLAVEEQYYLFFPILLFIIWRFGWRVTLATLVLIFLISIGLSEWGARNKPIANFYLSPTRVWELFAGSISAVIIHRWGFHKNNYTSFVGIAAILISILFYSEHTPIPSAYALLPVTGTMLIILTCDQNTIVGRTLSFKPLVWVGLISYSAYLIHQPLLAFARLTYGDDIPFAIIAAILIFILPMSWVSWRYVEQPFRKRNEDGSFKLGRTSVFSFSIAGMILFALLGLFITSKDGFPGRYTIEEQQVLKFANYAERDELYRTDECMLSTGSGLTAHSNTCAEFNTNYLVWGDSHAGALSVGLRESFPAAGQLTASSCAPILGFNSALNPNCMKINDSAFITIETVKPQTLIMHANWSGYIDDPKVIRELEETIKAINEASPQTRILLVGSVPQWKPSLPSALVNSKQLLRGDTKTKVDPLLLRRLKYFDGLLSDIAKANAEIEFVSIIDSVCDQGACQSVVTEDGVTEPLAWDYAHLTKGGSIYVVRSILEKLPGE